MDNRFLDVIQIIKNSRNNAIRAVNSELINLHWKFKTLNTAERIKFRRCKSV